MRYLPTSRLLHSEFRLVRARSARARTRPRVTLQLSVSLSCHFQTEPGGRDSKCDLRLIGVAVIALQRSALKRISRTPERSAQPEPFGSGHSSQPLEVNLAYFFRCVAQQHNTSSISQAFNTYRNPTEPPSPQTPPTANHPTQTLA